MIQGSEGRFVTVMQFNGFLPSALPQLLQERA
jgi:hypothetical protein